jgi:hypothetical protein
MHADLLPRASISQAIGRHSTDEAVRAKKQQHCQSSHFDPAVPVFELSIPFLQIGQTDAGTYFSDTTFVDASVLLCRTLMLGARTTTPVLVSLSQGSVARLFNIKDMDSAGRLNPLYEGIQPLATPTFRFLLQTYAFIL